MIINKKIFFSQIYTHINHSVWAHFEMKKFSNLFFFPLSLKEAYGFHKAYPSNTIIRALPTSGY